MIWCLRCRRLIKYEGWNYNFSNAVVTFDTAHLQSSYFHRPSMYSPMLCRTRSQQWGSRMMPLAVPVLLMVQTERPTVSIMSGTVLKHLPRSGSFTLGIKSKSQGLMSGEYGGWYSTSHCHLSRLVSLPFLDFSQTVQDPTRCDFAHVQAFFENVQDRRMGKSGLTGQLPNCPPSICLQQCDHWTNLGFCCAGSSGPWPICRILPSSAEGLNPPCNCPIR